MLIGQLVLNLPCVLVERYQAIRVAVLDSLISYVFDHPCHSTCESLDVAVGIVCAQEITRLNSLGYATIVVRG